jgi:hypothetical protein
MRLSIAFKFLFYFLLTPISKIVLKEVFPITSNFEKKFQIEFKKRFEQTFGISFDSADTNSFWLPYHYVCQNDVRTNPKVFRLTGPRYSGHLHS